VVASRSVASAPAARGVMMVRQARQRQQMEMEKRSAMPQGTPEEREGKKKKK